MKPSNSPIVNMMKISMLTDLVIPRTCLPFHEASIGGATLSAKNIVGIAKAALPVNGQLP
jgi:hypothetical protein